MSHEDDGGLIYGLEFQCRSLCAVQLAEEVDRIRFLVGTQGSKVTNQVHLVELEEETGALAKTLYSHPEGEIWQIESGFPGHVFATRHSRVDPGAAGAAGAPGCPVKADLWRLDQAGETPQQNSSAINELEKVGSLEAQGDVNHLAFTPTGDKVLYSGPRLIVQQNAHNNRSFYLTKNPNCFTKVATLTGWIYYPWIY